MMALFNSTLRRVIFLVAAVAVNAAVLTLNQEEVPSSSLFSKRVGMYNTVDSPTGNGLSTLHSRLEVKLLDTVLRNPELFDGAVIDMLMVHSDEYSQIGYRSADSQALRLCCTADLVGTIPGCTETTLNGLILPFLTRSDVPLPSSTPTTVPSVSPSPSMAPTTQPPTTSPLPTVSVTGESNAFTGESRSASASQSSTASQNANASQHTGQSFSSSQTAGQSSSASQSLSSSQTAGQGSSAGQSLSSSQTADQSSSASQTAGQSSSAGQSLSSSQTADQSSSAGQSSSASQSLSSSQTADQSLSSSQTADQSSSASQSFSASQTATAGQSSSSSNQSESLHSFRIRSVGAYKLLSSNDTDVSTATPSAKNFFFQRGVYNVTTGVIRFDGYFNIIRTGNHYIVIGNCDSRLLDKSVVIQGQIEARNPYGLLPAELYGYLPFYATAALVTLAAMMFWIAMMFLHRHELLQVQWIIFAVLLLSLAEMVAWYFDYDNYNLTGQRTTEFFLIGIVSSVVRRTVSRMLVIAVSMGFGVVQPELSSGARRRLFIFGALYLIFETALEVTIEETQSGGQSLHSQTQMMLTFPVALLDAICYWWVFVSLATVLNNLQLQQQNFKLDLYRNFSRLLMISLLTCTAFSIYQMKFIATKQIQDDWIWSLTWLLNSGFWTAQYLVTLLAIMWFWRPSAHATHYAYAQQISHDEHALPEDSAVIEMSLEPLPLDDDPDEDQESDDVIAAQSSYAHHIIADEYGADDDATPDVGSGRIGMSRNACRELAAEAHDSDDDREEAAIFDAVAQRSASFRSQ